MLGIVDIQDEEGLMGVWLLPLKIVVWLVGVFVALGATWGMTSQRVTAMESDLDRMETAIHFLLK